jgi:hypothetical protein
MEIPFQTNKGEEIKGKSKRKNLRLAGMALLIAIVGVSALAFGVDPTPTYTGCMLTQNAGGYPQGFIFWSQEGLSPVNPCPVAVSTQMSFNAGDTDWIISGTDMYSGVTGSVGIGTTTPGATLDVANSVGSNTPGEGHKLRFSTSAGTPLFGFRMDSGNNHLVLDKSWGGWGSPVLAISRNAGRIGISTTSPSAQLDVVGNTELNGDVEINSDLDVAGPVSADWFLYNNPYPGKVTIPAAAFNPVFSDTGFGGTLESRYVTSAPFGHNNLQAPLTELPVGAIVDELKCLLRDTSSSYGVHVSMHKVFFTGASSAEMASITTSAADNGILTRTDTTISFPTIDTDNGYVLSFNPGSSNCGADCAIMVCIISYTEDWVS